MKHPSDSLKKKYLFKLLTNLVGFLISMATQVIIPRGLGPRAYGDFTFLTNFFNEMVNFLDMGTSAGFYTKLSQRPHESRLVFFYTYFTIFVFIALIALVVVAAITGSSQTLWPGHQLSFVYLALFWGIATWAVQLLSKITDAYGLTVPAEKVRIFQKIFGLVLISFLFLTNSLNLKVFFIYHYVTLAVAVAGLLYVVGRSDHSFRQEWRLGHTECISYLREFYAYTHPLASYALVAAIASILDRWLLQVYGGSIQQGFFGLSQQVGLLCFLFTSAMTPLITREFAISFGTGDLEHMAVLFRRYIPLLYGIAAYIACFIAVQSDRVVAIMGGNAYQEASDAMALMTLYPIHQTYGQLSGSVFYATGQTRLYRNIGICLMLAGVPLTYFFLAPTGKMGLDAGARGLALKMLLLQFVGVNIQLYFNSRFLKLRFFRYLAHQIICLACLLILSYLSLFFISKFNVLSHNAIDGLIASGLLYTSLVVLVTIAFPSILGLHRQDISSLVRRIIKLRIPK